MTILKKVFGLTGFMAFGFLLTGCFTAQNALNKRQYDKVNHKAFTISLSFADKKIYSQLINLFSPHS